MKKRKFNKLNRRLEEARDAAVWFLYDRKKYSMDEIKDVFDISLPTVWTIIRDFKNENSSK